MRESKRSRYVQVVKPVTRGLTRGWVDATPRRYKYLSAGAWLQRRST